MLAEARGCHGTQELTRTAKLLISSQAGAPSLAGDLSSHKEEKND
jgi:hypothetical protein